MLVAIVLALHADPEYAERWRHAYRAIRGDVTAAAFVDARCDLPPAPEGFVGRHAELRLLDELINTRGTVVIHGMAGVGKTSLAMHAAHRRAGDRLRLFADLRELDAETPPACPSAVLGRFLRHLGLRHDQIPRDLAARVEAYQALVRETPALLVLDNAADEESVAPLVPDGPDHIVIVTSRLRLVGLRDTAHLQLDALDSVASLDLLRGIAGAARVDADIAGAWRIIARLGRHPLALSIVGRHLKRRPDWSVADCARPVALALASGVRSALSVSCRRLPAAARRVLHLLALHPAHDIDCHAVGALIGTEVGTARRHLSELEDAHLVRQSRNGRYCLHELVRGYASELVGLEEGASQVHAARGRVVRLLPPRRCRGRLPSRSRRRRGPFARVRGESAAVIAHRHQRVALDGG